MKPDSTRNDEPEEYVPPLVGEVPSGPAALMHAVVAAAAVAKLITSIMGSIIDEGPVRMLPQVRSRSKRDRQEKESVA